MDECDDHSCGNYGSGSRDDESRRDHPVHWTEDGLPGLLHAFGARGDRFRQPGEVGLQRAEALEAGQSDGPLGRAAFVQDPGGQDTEGPLAEVQGIEGLLVLVVQQAEHVHVRAAHHRG
jgi:hypothetical protein